MIPAGWRYDPQAWDPRKPDGSPVCPGGCQRPSEPGWVGGWIDPAGRVHHVPESFRPWEIEFPRNPLRFRAEGGKLASEYVTEFQSYRLADDGTWYPVGGRQRSFVTQGVMGPALPVPVIGMTADAPEGTRFTQDDGQQFVMTGGTWVPVVPDAPVFLSQPLIPAKAPQVIETPQIPLPAPELAAPVPVRVVHPVIIAEVPPPALDNGAGFRTRDRAADAAEIMSFVSSAPPSSDPVVLWLHSWLRDLVNANGIAGALELLYQLEAEVA